MNESRQAKSIKARLLNMATGENKRYQQLIIRYIHERLLLRLSKSIYQKQFILKGGALLYAYENFTPRPTLDIDFMGRYMSNDKVSIISAITAITSMSYPEDGIEFLTETIKAENITVDKKYPGISISMTATLGSYKQNITVDIGFGDVIVPHPIELKYPTILESMEEPEILTYSLESVVAEKFQTMIIRGVLNSRMKDYFDLYRIFDKHKFEKPVLAEAIKSTFENRSTKFDKDNGFFNEDFGANLQMNQNWNNYIRKMKLDLPSFPEIHKAIKSALSPYWELLNMNQ